MCENLSHLIQIKEFLSNTCCFTEDNKPHKDNITETTICYNNRPGNSENMYSKSLILSTKCILT